MNQTSVTAVFDHPSAARDAEAALSGAGLELSSLEVFAGESEEVLRRRRLASPNEIQRKLVPPDVGSAVGFTLGFLGGGFFGLLMGTGSLNLMGKGPAMAAGPFLSALIGAVVLGLAGALAGYIFNAPLPALDPAEGSTDAGRKVSILNVVSKAGQDGEIVDVLERFGPSKVQVWHRADDSAGAAGGTWLPA